MSTTDVQALLRFLTKDAKVPLATAMSKVKDMQSAQLGTADEISKSKVEHIKNLFPDEKVAKQILSAAKRISKKRAGDDGITLPTPPKRRRLDPFETPDLIPASEVEQSLQLPTSSKGDGEIGGVTLITNRAPVVLAFAVTLLKYTMPEQPLSSRLSLAQAVVSMNSQSKAKNIGLSSGKTAEEEGWGQGQPTVKVMSRDISVLKRWGYEWKTENETAGEVKVEGGAAETELKANIETLNATKAENEHSDDTPALWGLDLDQLKKLNGPLAFNATSTTTAGLPVYSPQAARNYLLRAFEVAPVDVSDESSKKPKKKTAATMAVEREQNLGDLLKALDMLYESWVGTLSSSDLDRRAWSWYVKVRPEVENGTAGWGAKGPFKLADILALRRGN